MKAAALAAELGDKKRAVRLFDLCGQIARRRGMEDRWPFWARCGMNYELGEYKKVTALSEKPSTISPEEARPEVLLLAGNSYRQLGNMRSARAVYDRLLLQFPNAKPSEDARFYRLVSMYQLNDPALLAEADQFLQNPPMRSRKPR